MKLLIKSLLLFALLFLLNACNSEKTYKIGVSQCSSDDWREKMNEEINRETILHENLDVEIRSADDSNAKQIADIDYFVNNGFDMIIVSPNEAAALTPKIKEVYEKGIPIVIFDRNINGDTYTARMGVDDIGLGRQASEYGRHLVGNNGKALEIFGLRGSTPAEDRHTGFINDFLSHGGTILASEAANWNQEDAERVADSLLRLYPEVDLIFAHNDRMAIGASVVARKVGRDNIKIIGIDAAPNIGIQAVADRVIDATFLYPTEGHKLIQLALKILEGQPYEKEVRLPLSSAVDTTNADILLFQNDMLLEETSKIRKLKGRVDEYWEQHSSQTSLFYASIAILLLLCGFLFMLLRSFWQHRRHQAELLEQNHLLEQERDKQKELTHTQMELNRELRELNMKLEEATQSKLAFFTNVSHDLRTPLTLIAEPVAQLNGAPNLTSSQRTLMKIADKNVRILQRLINQILDFRKYENGKLKLHLTEVDFRKVMSDWTESFIQLARKRDIHLTLDAPEGTEPINMALDVEKMERVFFNLVSNAFKYTRDNGSITILYRVEASRLILKVKDTGEGISERDLGNIFDRFYQVDRIHPKGSGIGLSLVKAFVELHGGSITVSSELNKGSEFIVTLPITHVAEATQSVDKLIGSAAVEAELENIDSEGIFDSAKPLVLVIDDNRDIREMVSELLKEEYSVITASNGTEGVKKAAKYVPDLIVCDVMMPGIDGLESCRRIKNETVTSHIPVLMLTACSLDEQRVQGYDSGADGYLSKPFSTDVLKSRIASLIKNRQIIKELWQNPASKIEDKKQPLNTSADTKEVSTEKGSGAQSVRSDAETDFYARFLKIFYHDMSDPDTTVDSLAAKMGLERTQFYRKIKAITNYSPVELIRSLRLKKARAMVTGSEKSISEICYDVGFSTPAYFTKCYRDSYGETPSETRQKMG